MVFIHENDKILNLMTNDMNLFALSFGHLSAPSSSEQRVLQTYPERAAGLPFDPLEAPAAQALINRAFSGLVELFIERH